MKKQKLDSKAYVIDKTKKELTICVGLDGGNGRWKVVIAGQSHAERAYFGKNLEGYDSESSNTFKIEGGDSPYTNRRKPGYFLTLGQTAQNSESQSSFSTISNPDKFKVELSRDAILCLVAKFLPSLFLQEEVPEYLWSHYKIKVVSVFSVQNKASCESQVKEIWEDPGNCRGEAKNPLMGHYDGTYIYLKHENYRYRFDFEFLKNNFRYYQEGHFIAAFASKKLNNKTNIHILDFGSGTVQLTQCESSGKSQGKTIVANNTGACEVYRLLKESKQLASAFKKLGDSIDHYSTESLAEIFERDRNNSDKQINWNQIVAKQYFPWFGNEKLHPIFDRLRVASRKGEKILVVGGCLCFPDFFNSLKKYASKINIDETSLVDVSTLYKGINPSLINAQTLHSVAVKLLQKI